MPVEVKVTSVLQKITGAKVVQGDGGTVGELLSDLDGKYPGFKNQIMQEGSLHRFVNIYLNDEDIRYLDQLNTRVKDGDSISILPALAGGEGSQFTVDSSQYVGCAR
jgi:MoaD family protein